MLSSTPAILQSIWNAVIPFSVPVTLKSMSPRWSSTPRISLKTATRPPSITSPIAIPATAFLTGTPASMSARLPPHTVAIELEPFDSRMSETSRTVYGKSSSDGIIGFSARSASAP